MFNFLANNGIKNFIGVPDSTLKHFIEQGLKKKMKWKIPLYKIFTDGEDNRAVNKVLQRGMDWAIGHENHR